MSKQRSNAPTSQPINRRRYLTIGLLFFILLLALALRLYNIDAQSLWNDEGTSVAVAQRSLVTIARDAAQDIHPPLYYWLLSGWVRLFGTSEAAVRALSALLGVILVVVVYLLGCLLAGHWAGLAAALLAAINPFQVYYAQEARMYMLLALWGALAFYAALRWAASSPGERPLGWAALYVLVSAAGLYTHYAFPLVLLVVNLVILLYVALQWRATRLDAESGGGRRLWHWLALQVVVALLFIPWLPAAYRQLGTWPRVDQSLDLLAVSAQISQLFSTGPAAPPWIEAVWVLLLLFLAFYPSGRSRRLPNGVAYLVPLLWLLVPVLLILILGLYRGAYLKFLLVASPAFCLLAGRFITAPLGDEHVGGSGISPNDDSYHRRRSRAVVLIEGLLAVVVAGFLVSASVYGLHHYYNGPAYARDNYRGIVGYIDALGRPGDAILLNAPGQQEVFSYYYQGELPVHPLPGSRPLDPAATEASLEELARPGGRVYAVLWATDESDPERFVEGWLDAHTYKALDSWYGNVRLVVYAVPERTPEAAEHELNVRLRSAETGDEVTLLGYSLLGDRLAAGDIAQITLFWQAERPPAGRYKVFLHALDDDNHIVGQRDAEPAGGAYLTNLWQPGEVVADNHGLPIHPATPPGEYRVEVGMYDPETGRRLVTEAGDSQVWLEPLAIERPPAPAPTAALGMQHAGGAGFGELALLGYDAFSLGFAHQPEVPLRPGDVLHVNLYWRAEAQPSGDWQVTLDLVDSEGTSWASIAGEPVGGYATSKWQAGDLWRGQFNLPLPSGTPPGRLWLVVWPVVPDGSQPEPFQSEPFTVAP